MKTKPKVSVIMPVYNRERYLPQAIESVLNQSFRDFELIIVDGGFTDRSRDIIEEYTRKDARIRCTFREGNRGVSAARNTALCTAQGEWIAVIDSDDAWHPSRLAKLLAIAEEGFFVADDLLLCFDKNGELIPWRRQSVSYGIKFPGNSKFLEMGLKVFLSKGAPGIQPLFPSSVIIEHRLQFTEGCQFGEDFEFWCHLFRVGLKLRILPAHLYLYRLTPSALTAKSNVAKTFAHLLAVHDKFLAHHRFSEKEKELLQLLRQKAERDKECVVFSGSLERGCLLGAVRIASRDPALVWRLLRGLPSSLRYRISAKILRGALKINRSI